MIRDYYAHARVYIPVLRLAQRLNVSKSRSCCSLVSEPWGISVTLTSLSTESSPQVNVTVVSTEIGFWNICGGLILPEPRMEPVERLEEMMSDISDMIGM